MALTNETMSHYNRNGSRRFFPIQRQHVYNLIGMLSSSIIESLFVLCSPQRCNTNLVHFTIGPLREPPI